MAIIRAFTTIEQSRKLAEILPLESADMYYDGFGRLPQGYAYTLIHPNSFSYDRPCWSLAALLGVLPDELEDNHFLTLQKEKNEYCCCYEGLNNSFRHNTFADNPVDACYEMIIKLHELNLL